jgi:hypothetical protein
VATAACFARVRRRRGKVSLIRIQIPGAHVLANPRGKVMVNDHHTGHITPTTYLVSQAVPTEANAKSHADCSECNISQPNDVGTQLAIDLRRTDAADDDMSVPNYAPYDGRNAQAKECAAEIDCSQNNLSDKGIRDAHRLEYSGSILGCQRSKVHQPGPNETYATLDKWNQVTSLT